MPGILTIIPVIFSNQFKCICVQNQKLFVNILLHFQNLYKILNILKNI